MIKNLPVEEDLALKRYSSIPQDQKPRFNWKEVFSPAPDAGVDDATLTSITIKSENGESTYDLADIADTVGTALTNLLLSREESDIFNEKNRRFVASIAQVVTERLTKQALRDQDVRIQYP